MADNPTISKLASLPDKTGQIVEVKFCNQASIGPAELMSFFYKNLAELIDAGHGLQWPGYSSKSMAVYLEIDNVIVGHIMFNFNADMKQTHIVLSAVDKNYRNRGLYKILHYELMKVSKKLGATQITSFVHINNTIMKTAAQSVDYSPQFYKMLKDI
jgi:ribosomal protein S18 acetylase RimI-like enzyme